MDIWRPHGITIGADNLTSVELGGLTNASLDLDYEINRGYVDGSPQPRNASKRGLVESLSATTVDVDKAIDTLGSTGVCLAGTTADEGVDFFVAKYSACTVGPLAGSVHRKYSIDFSSVGDAEVVGMVIPQNMSCDHRGDLTYSFNITAVNPDGDHSMWTETAGVALPTGSEEIIDSQKRYSIGNVTVGGVALTGVKSITVNFEIQTITEGADSNMFAQYIGIEQIGATIDIMGIDPTWIDSTGFKREGIAFTHANTGINFRQRDRTDASGFYGAATSNHITCTSAGFAVPVTLASGSGGPAECGIRLFCEYDGTNNPLVLATDAAQI